MTQPKPTREINNLFDFIDYLTDLNFTPGTANENRLFTFDTIRYGAEASDDFDALQSAYAAVGVSVPQSTLQQIFDLSEEFPGSGNFIRILAPNSLVPSDNLPLIEGTFENDFITYYNATYINPITGDTITKEFYLTFNDILTPSQIRQAAQDTLQTKYNFRVISLSLLRFYATELH